MSEITWEQLSADEQAVLRNVHNDKYPEGMTYELWCKLDSMGLLTDLGKRLLAQADSGKPSLLDTVEAEVTRAVTEGTVAELTESDFAVDEKPTVIDAATFVRKNYAAKIAAGECVVTQYSIAVLIIDPKDSDGFYRVRGVNGDPFFTYGTIPFTVTWLPDTAPTVPAQPADASGAGELPNPFDELDSVGYAIAMIGATHLMGKPGYENSVRRHLNDIENYWRKAQAELAVAKAEAARLREALKPFADAYEEIPEGLRSTLRIMHPYEDGVMHLKSANTDHLKQAAAALNAGEE